MIRKGRGPEGATHAVARLIGRIALASYLDLEPIRSLPPLERVYRCRFELVVSRARLQPTGSLQLAHAGDRALEGKGYLVDRQTPGAVEVVTPQHELQRVGNAHTFCGTRTVWFSMWYARRGGIGGGAYCFVALIYGGGERECL